MSKTKLIDYSSDIDINSIFERKIELGAVIQFNLLQTVLEEFIKRQKKMSDKISKLEFKISRIQIGGHKDMELQPKKSTNKLTQKSEEDFSKKKEDKKKKNENEKVQEKDKSIDLNKNKDLDASNNEEKNSTIINENLGNIENLDNLENIDKENDIFTRVEKLESMYSDFTDFIKKINNNFNEFKTQTSHAHKYHENKITELFRKVADINSFEMLKEDTKPNLDNLEMPNDIVNSLDQKLSERIETLEKKTKLNDDSIYSIKRDIVTIKNLNENISKLARTNQDSIDNLSKDMQSKIKLINTKIDNEAIKLREECDNNYKENKSEINRRYNELNNKLNNLIEEINKSNKKVTPITFGNEKLNDLYNEIKNYVNKGIDDTERYLKSMIHNLNIDKIQKDLSEIHEEIDKIKLFKKDIELINIKISDVIEKKLIELLQRVDAQSTDINLCNDTCNKTVKMVEYLSGQIVQTYQPDLENNNSHIINYSDLKQNINMASYMTKDLFKEEKNKLLKKIEKTLEIEGENYMFIKKLEEKLKFSVSENDLRNMEQCFINLLEELKAFFNKKYLEKNEAQKTFKYIELQLKQIIETGNFSNKDGENWLLAKKPMNSYVCASCETYLGELKSKNIFLPWNKIPSREEKKYRMGHGFSKMLQLLNADLLKNAEVVNNDSKISEKKIDEYKKLPKINSQLCIHNQNNTYSIMQSNDSGDHYENGGLNNSADNVEQLTEIKKTKESKKNMSSSCYNNTIDKEKDNKDKDNIKSYHSIKMQTNKNFYRFNLNNNLSPQDPKIMRIIKKSKK